MDNNMKLYYDYTVSPLGKLFYKTVFNQLSNIKNKKVLDFGSGFAFTSNFLAENNDVTAIELNKVMIDNAENTHRFNQIEGNLTALKSFEDETFDVIICHLVFEFIDEPIENFLSEFTRVLKKGGLLSVIRHNKNGRITQAVVLDYDLEDAKKLLSGANSFSGAFGDIKYYTNKYLFNLTKNNYIVKNIYGVRTLASLHNAQTMQNEHWLSNMLEMETQLCENDDFINIAYFNHIILIKN